MVFEIRMPDFGSGVDEASILEWKKETGDSLRRGDTVCTVEAEKAVEDVVSPGDGTLRVILEEEGSSLSAGTLLAVVADPGDDIAAYRGGP